MIIAMGSIAEISCPTLAIAWPPEDWKINGDHQGAAQVNGIVG
jgi:hypothetical protein